MQLISVHTYVVWKINTYLLTTYLSFVYFWVIILNFSSFFIILFAVDLSFPIFVSNMSVAVIFPLFSSMRAGHSSSICVTNLGVIWLDPHNFLL